jgi:hypothetical protein
MSLNGRSEEQQQKVDVLKKLYPLVTDKTLDIVISLVSYYGGTMLSDLILDTYDYMIYNEYPTTTKYLEEGEK